MGSSSRHIFGHNAVAEPATPGSYGEAPPGHRLPASTRLGTVRLQVADLERSVAFYERVLGLRVVERDAVGAALAAHDDPRVLVSLTERRGARTAGRPPKLGLYHYAILLPDRAALGRLVRHLAEIGVHPGAGDHLVSEAFYMNDPDGLGIEVYADRPRSAWRRVGRELMMATDPVDIAGLVAEAGGESWTGMPAGTVIGHVHLHVGDLDRAAAFYSDALGLDRTAWSYPGALFLGAGGYHHHLGTNTWAGPDARPAEEGDARLLEWTIELPDTAGVEAVRRSLIDAGHAAADASHGGVVTRDPWGIRLRVTTA
jgi:catechol 2,3-dioxygenase